MTDEPLRLSHAGPRDLSRLVDAVLSIGSGLQLDDILQRIIQAAVDLLDARYGALGVLAGDGETLSRFITVGIDHAARERIGAPPKGLGLLGSLIRDRQPLRVAQLDEHPDSIGFPPNHPPMKSFLGVPVRVGTEVFGNLYLTDKTTAEVFSDVDQELALGLAAAAGVAIENARLYEQARQGERVVTALNAVASAVLDGAGATTGLDVVASTARELLGAMRTSVSLLDGPDHLRVEVAHGDDADTLIGHRWPFAGTPCGDVLAGAPPIAVEDATEIARIGQTPLRDGSVGPTLFVALASGEVSFGVLTIARRRGGPLFSEAESALAQAFASQASVVVDHARGREQRDRLQRLEEREQIGLEVHGSIVRRLYATGLALEGILRITEDPVARARLQQLTVDLDGAVAEIRTALFADGIE